MALHQDPGMQIYGANHRPQGDDHLTGNIVFILHFSLSLRATSENYSVLELNHGGGVAGALEKKAIFPQNYGLINFAILTIRIKIYFDQK